MTNVLDYVEIRTGRLRTNPNERDRQSTRGDYLITEAEPEIAFSAILNRALSRLTAFGYIFHLLKIMRKIYVEDKFFITITLTL